MLTRRPIEEASSTYKNKTLVHNWYEDRLATTDHKLSTTDRIMALDVGAIPAPPPELATTKRADDHARMTNPLPAAVKKPSMYNDATLKQRLETYGTPASLAFTMGRTLPSEDSKAPESHYETTNMHFYSSLPTTATSRDPEYFTSSLGKTFHKKEGVMKTSQDPTQAEAVAGRGGARGEVTRNPREGGNPYGVSVFVDEYAQWQTKLNGMPLEESVRRAQTKYF